ncbi:MAG: hypothetical protein R2712_31685, partial [Vicinamibacterales bacterium]
MEAYLRRATAALTAFLEALGAFDAARERLAASGAVAGALDERLARAAARVRAAAGRLEHSLDQIARTGLDIVDLQVRMEGEGAALAAGLAALGDALQEEPDAAWGGTLQDLEEAAARVAAALFPAAIEGVRDINRALWQFRPIWHDYGRVLAQEVARRPARLTADQLARVDDTARAVSDAFERVNALLNELATATTGDAAQVRGVIRSARAALPAAVRHARSRAADAYKPFHGVLKRAEKLAREIDGRFAGLRVPVFPHADALDLLADVIPAARYEELAGVERFALFNIASRLRSIPTADGAGHLLAPHFEVRVFDVFPDRVYFTARATLIDAIEALVASRVFEPAPASLHRFRDGSFKQRQFRRGNLQVSYAAGSPERPDDRERV